MRTLTFASSHSRLSRTETPNFLGIHREAPPFVDQSTEMEMLSTGIKVRNRTTGGGRDRTADGHRVVFAILSRDIFVFPTPQ
jgi:hypothetical protein